jgi:hypothetical protein
MAVIRLSLLITIFDIFIAGLPRKFDVMLLI